MAIFKKIFISENSSQNGKISSNNTITNTTTTSITDKQTTQTNPLTSSCSSYNENLPLNDNENQEKIPEDLKNICCHIYFRLLKRSEIRLIIFSEKSFRLLYDSDTVVAVSERIVAGSHRSQCGQFQFLPHKNDTIRIAKMLFGTLPTSLNSDSLKIHSLRDSDSLMVSRVFSIPKFGKYSSPFKTSDLYKCLVGSLSSTDSDNQSNYSTIRSLEGIRDKDGTNTNPGRFPLITSKTFTNPDPPEKFVRVRNSSLQLESNAMDDLMDELRAFSPNRLSRTRRRQLSQFGMDESLSIRVSNRSRLSSCSSIADGGASDSSAECHQGYGLALILPNEFRPFIFQHIIQIESELDILAIQIHKAVQDKSQFFQQISEGWKNICDSLCLLCNSLRLKTPVWLSLASSETSKKELIAAEFCDTLFYLNDCLNTKETKFFLSTLLSAILMNQLTWVASVAPPEKCSYDHRSLLLGMNVIDTKQLFYNPTIAQLLELYYGIGTANGGIRRFTKIVIVGENLDLTGKLLQVLSYFIRCSSVESRRNETLEICVSDDEECSFDFGHSLLAGICTSYSPHFVLSGIQAKQDSFSDIISSIFEDARHPMGEPCTNSKLMLSLSPTNSNVIATSTGSGNQQTNVKLPAGISSPEKLIKPQLQERKDSLIVFIDMYGFVVRIISAENCQIDDVPFVCPSDAITSMLEEFAELYGYKCAPDFLLSFIEDKLGALLLKSNVLVNLVTTGMEEESLSMERVSSILDCSISDLRLILNIASVWAPGIQTTAL